MRLPSGLFVPLRVSESSGAPRRHELLWFAPAAWDGALAGLYPQGVPQELVDWVRRDPPVIMRRQMHDEVGDATRLAVGMPLPTAWGRLRLGLTMPACAVRARRRAVALDETRYIAPQAWQATIEAVLELGIQLGITPAVFGSLLWQYLTDEVYLHAESDLDLLWPMPDPAGLRHLLVQLSRIEAKPGAPRLDGELLLADGTGLNWRELRLVMHDDCPRVLAKGPKGVGLVDATGWLGQRESAGGACDAGG